MAAVFIYSKFYRPLCVDLYPKRVYNDVARGSNRTESTDVILRSKILPCAVNFILHHAI